MQFYIQSVSFLIRREDALAIVGIESLVYGVEDFAKSVAFFEDFGLPMVKCTDGDSVSYARFRVAGGASVHVRKLDDPWFLKSDQVGVGVRECIWGVDSQETLNELVDDLRRDHNLSVEADGTVRFVTAFGQALGLKVWSKTPVYSASSPVNTHGNINRVNETRKWIKRAIPKTINHVVWSFPDVNEALDFYRGRLNFRISEIQLGSGVYIRADGAGDHHNVFLADANNKTLGFDGKIQFHHANFGVEDIDEIMVGKNYMERREWPKSSWGLGRHRLSSGAFLYLPCPAGGAAEYGADIDYLDDRWVPRIWDQLFGFVIYLHDMPEFLKEQELEWNVGFCDPMDYYPLADTPGSQAAPPAQSAITRK